MMRMRIRAGLLLLAIGLGATGSGFAGPAEESGAVRTEMRNVIYHFTESSSAKIVTLSGSLEPTTPGHWPVLDDKTSFRIHVDSARFLVLPSHLATVLNNYVFSTKDAPLKGVSATIEKDKLKIKGKLHSKGDIPFETQASLSADPDGRVRLHTEKVSALHLPVKGLMDL